ncbi:MAG TPA: helix-turn-helix transcriptional regulator [Pseudolabrys sp.]|nr:helix-turn-helix transcriptional regulator [Pseudolabrys sp.]
MPARIAPDNAVDLAHLIRMERLAFAAKVRMARAVAGLSQSELAARIGMTQRSIHKLEQGGTEPRRATVAALEMLWREQGVEFEDLADGGFRVVVRAEAFEALVPARRPRAARSRAPSSGYRA